MSSVIAEKPKRNNRSRNKNRPKKRGRRSIVQRKRRKLEREKRLLNPPRTMLVTVDDLLRRPFLSRPREEKIEIIQEGKPRPDLAFLKSDKNVDLSTEDTLLGNNEKDSTSFPYTALYDHVDWLTGCNIRQALYCWTCLLFRPVMDSRYRWGSRDMNDLLSKLDDHRKCLSHIQSTLDFQLFLPQIKTDKPASRDITHEVIKRNREVAKRIIDAVCGLIIERQDGNRSRLSSENCILNLQLIREYDIVKTGIIDDAIGMLQVAPGIVDDMVEAITSLMRTSIHDELHKSTYVSIILGEHSREEAKSRISVVLRYVQNGKVCERFVEFINYKKAKVSNTICNHINKVIKDFQIAEKLLAFSMDALVFPDLDIFNLYVNYARDKEDILNFRHSYICNVPCHFHRLDYMLRQSLSVCHECDYFFKNLASLRSLLRDGAKMREDFINFLIGITGKMPELNALDSVYLSEALAVIKSHRRNCILFFEYISKTNSVAEGDLADVRGLCDFLRDFRTYFLLHTFAKFYSAIQPLEEALDSSNQERTLHTLLIERVLKSLLNVDKGNLVWQYSHIEKAFEEFFECVVQAYEEEEKPIKEQASDEISNKCYYNTLYSNILKCVTNQIKFRFQNNEKPSFLNVLNLKSKDERLNVDFAEKLTLFYGDCFDLVNTRSEIKLLEGHEAVLKCDSVHHLIDVFLSLGLNISCPNLYKLTELVLTLPCTPSDLNNSKSSKLNDLLTWSDEEIGDSSLVLHIERDYLDEIKSRFLFHDRVMARFQNKNSILQLL